MPILRDYTDSLAVNSLDAPSERFFVRLLTKVDDYGIFHADCRLLKSHLFPLSRDIREADISRWSANLHTAGLIRFYHAENGRKYLQVLKFNQRKKWMKSEHPPPVGQMSLLAAEELLKPKRSRREEERDAPSLDCPDANIPTLAEVLAYAETIGSPPDSAKRFYEHHEGNALWLNQHHRLINWKTKLKTWTENDRIYKTNGRNGHTRPDRNAGTYNANADSTEFQSKIR